MSKKLPSQRVLNRLLRYDPETGFLYWRDRPAWMFKRHKHGSRKVSAKIWNKRRAGKRAFTSIDKQGAHQAKFLGIRTFAHRVIWKMMTGEDANIVDHDNGRPSDNRWQNLNNGSQSDNRKNIRIPSNNTSGVIGVHKCAQTGKWRANIATSGDRSKHLGRFDSFDEAVAVRKTAEKKYGYNDNHGRA